MAKFDVRFTGDSRGVNTWGIHLEGGNDTSDLIIDRKHALNLIDCVFDAIGQSYKLKKNNTQTDNKGDNSNAQ